MEAHIMYFVDQKKIEERLIYMDHLLEFLENETFESPIEKLGKERIVHVLIESLLDVGNMMIDGFIMRDPGSYEDIIDILVDEKVIPAKQETGYKEFISLRKNLVTDYVNVDDGKMNETITSSIPALKDFSTYIQSYLKNELGVANAFLKE